MPRLPTIHCAPLAELARQLRFAPPAAARRHVERCEALADRLDESGVYPEDWVAVQITGFRPSVAEPALLRGADVLRDLGSLVARLSVAARWPAPRESDGWLTPSQLAARWGVSRRTLERWRPLGLWSRRVVGEGGRAWAAYAPKVVERFERRHAETLAGARARPARIGAARSAAILAAARPDETANAAARRLTATGGPAEAVARGLSRDGVRRLIARSRGAAPAGLGARGRALAERAISRGVPAVQVAKRLGTSRAVVARAWLTMRLERAASAATGGPVSPREAAEVLIERGGAEAVLMARAACTGLGAAAPLHLDGLLAEAEALGPQSAEVELSRAKAWWVLLARARRAAEALASAGAPTPVVLDALERDLLWAARLRAELVRAQVPLLLRTVRTQLGAPLEELPGARGGALLEAMLVAAVEAVEQFDPWSGGRLAGPMGLAASRVVARWPAAEAVRPGQARPLAAAGRVPVWDWTAKGCPWQSGLELSAEMRRRAALLGRVDALWIARRMGWALAWPASKPVEMLGGERPMLLAEAGRAEGINTLAAARRRERSLLRTLRHTTG